MWIKLSCLLVPLAAAALAHEPISTRLTWSQEISRIIYKHCVSCHHEGGPAMSLVTYEEARPWAKAIRDEVLERRMPPWGAVKGVGEFRDDPSLSQLEIDMIVNWVEGGAPNGDNTYLPQPPHFHAEKPALPAAGAQPILVDTAVARTLMKNVDVISVRPQQLPEEASLEVTAYLPDRSVKRLIWLRHYRKQWVRTYFFREPVRLPRGTRVAVYSAAPASAVIAVAKPAR